MIVGGPVQQIVASGSHACALLTTGKVRCWGSGVGGALGHGDTADIGDDETPASAGDVQVGGSVSKLSAGTLSTCAILSSGALRCWGSAHDGVLGYGNTNDIGDNELPLTAGDVDAGGAVAAIALGADRSCALLVSGGVRCWGWLSNSLTVIGDDEPASRAPLANFTPAVQGIEVGIGQDCVLLADGDVRCWSSGEPPFAPSLPIGGPVKQLSLGCALLTSGHVRCWGDFYVASGYPGIRKIDITPSDGPASFGDIAVE